MTFVIPSLWYPGITLSDSSLCLFIFTLEWFPEHRILCLSHRTDSVAPLDNHSSPKFLVIYMPLCVSTWKNIQQQASGCHRRALSFGAGTPQYLKQYLQYLLVNQVSLSMNFGKYFVSTSHFLGAPVLQVHTLCLWLYQSSQKLTEAFMLVYQTLRQWRHHLSTLLQFLIQSIYL